MKTEFEDGKTAIGLALEVLIKEMFAHENGDREGINIAMHHNNYSFY